MPLVFCGISSFIFTFEHRTFYKLSEKHTDMIVDTSWRSMPLLALAADFHYRMLDRMETAARYLGMDVHGEWYQVFAQLAAYERHQVRSALRLFYEGGRDVHRKLSGSFPNGAYAAHAIERLMYMRMLSAKDFRQEARVAERLRANLRILEMYGMFKPSDANWAEAKRHMSGASMLPSIDTGRFMHIETAKEQAYAIVRQPNTLEWGMESAVDDLVDYAAFELMGDARFRCRPERVTEDGESWLEYAGYGTMLSPGCGINPAAPIADICDMGYVVSDLFVEDGKLRAWLSGENIRKKIDVKELK